MAQRIHTASPGTIVLSLAVMLALPLAGIAHTNTPRDATPPRSTPPAYRDALDMDSPDLALDEALGFLSDDILVDLIAIDILFDEDLDDRPLSVESRTPRSTATTSRSRCTTGSATSKSRSPSTRCSRRSSRSLPPSQSVTSFRFRVCARP
jgi:hypothetical protein